MNYCVFTGRLTKDPELQTTASGVPYCRFNLAVERRFKNDQGEKGVDFIPVIAWRKRAEACAEYARKGMFVGVFGTYESGSYEKDGQMIYTHVFNLGQIDFYDSPKQQAEQEIVIDEENLPF